MLLAVILQMDNPPPPTVKKTFADILSCFQMNTLALYVRMPPMLNSSVHDINLSFYAVLLFLLDHVLLTFIYRCFLDIDDYL